MAEPIAYALLANAGYRDIRGALNLPLVPQGWNVLTRVDFGITGTPQPSGFSAEVFESTATNEIVISYQGTNPDKGDDHSRDWRNNFQLFQRAFADQLRDAALVYARVRKENPTATISLTGHSLGGGLASLVAVLFGESATVFAPAPFRGAASVGNGILLQSLIRARPDLYADDNRVLDLILNFNTVYSARAAQVRGYYVQGEALETHLLAGRTDQNTIAFGNLQPILVDTPQLRTQLNREGLHSMQLHIAAFQSAGLRDASKDLPQLLRLMDAPSLYGRALSSNDEKDFVQKLLELQFGAQPGASNTLDQFGADTGRIAKGGLLGAKSLREAVIVAAIEYYNFLNAPPSASYITDVMAGGTARGIRFDLGVIGEGGTPPATLKSRDRLVQYLNGRYAELKDLTGLAAPEAKRVWVLQGGTEPLVATESGANASIMVGFTGSDNLTGGGGDDLLIGDAGNDRLNGGAGADVLVGGAGSDAYGFAAGGGVDRIRDSGGDGQVFSGGTQLKGTEGTSNYSYVVLDNRNRRDWAVGDVKYTYLEGGANTGAVLEITSAAWNATDKVVIDGFDLRAAQSGQGYLGIKLGDKPDARLKTGYAPNGYDGAASGSTNPVVTQNAGSAQTVTFDLSAPAQAGDVVVLSQSGLSADAESVIRGADVVSFSGGPVTLALSEGQRQASFGLWANGNIASNQSGTLTATLVRANPDPNQVGPIQATATVNLVANALSDTPPVTTNTIRGSLTGGSVIPDDFNDILNGTAANDRIEGLGGGDFVIAGAGDDHVLGGFGDDTMFSDGFGASGSDWIEGGPGRDSALAGPGDDVVIGGADDMPGNLPGDYFLGGDFGNDRVYAGVQADEATVFNSDDVAASPGLEWLDGYDGDDRLIASSANDALTGGAGADVLAGGAGADVLLGGAGDDLLTGNEGALAQRSYSKRSRPNGGLRPVSEGLGCLSSKFTINSRLPG